MRDDQKTSCIPVDFSSASYEKHRLDYLQCARGGERAEHAGTWLREDTVDAWRHHRMYKMLNPLLERFPNAAWLTVGDGRYGKDAAYIASKGGDVLATDISDVLLQEAADAGLIPRFARENAERLSFGDGEFDFCLCKESYHHFPRPMISLYELLRVARRGVVLIEPNDRHLPLTYREKVFNFFVDILKRIMGKEKGAHLYEEVGNYVFSLSRREVEKVALGLNLRTVAFLGLNDYYQPGVEHESTTESNRIFRKVRWIIAAMDVLCRLRFQQPLYLAAVILKEPVDASLAVRMRKQGFDVIVLPSNPYAN